MVSSWFFLEYVIVMHKFHSLFIKLNQNIVGNKFRNIMNIDTPKGTGMTFLYELLQSATNYAHTFFMTFEFSRATK